MAMKPTPMPKKTGKPKKAMGMAYGGMSKTTGMNMGGMAKPGYGDQSKPSVPKSKTKPGAGAPIPGRGVRPMPMPGMAKGGMTKKGKK
jgi:hypothetical protein